MSALTQLCDVTKTYAAQLGCKPEASCVASLTQARDGYGPACAALYDDYSSCLAKEPIGSFACAPAPMTGVIESGEPCKTAADALVSCAKTAGGSLAFGWARRPSLHGAGRAGRS